MSPIPTFFRGGVPRGAHLHPGAALLGDVVAVHDVQDLVTHCLRVTSAAHGTQHGPHPLLRLAARLAVRLHPQQEAPHPGGTSSTALHPQRGMMAVHRLQHKREAGRKYGRGALLESVRTSDRNAYESLDFTETSAISTPTSEDFSALQLVRLRVWTHP